MFSVIIPKYTKKKLQKGIGHAHKAPTIPHYRITALYKVNVISFRQIITGTQVTYAAAHRDKQLFSLGEERAIADHWDIMSCLKFPISHDLLQKLQQDILNSCKYPLKTKGGIVVNQPANSGEDLVVHAIVA